MQLHRFPENMKLTAKLGSLVQTSGGGKGARLIVEEPDQLGSSAARTSATLLTPDAAGRPELE